MFTLLFCLITTTAYNAELLMFSMKSCVYCRSFLKEVAQEYKNTEYAKILPLRIISMDRTSAPKWFDLAYDQQRIDPIRGTPTFIVWDNGQEVARLIGYNGKKRWYDDISRFVNDNRQKLTERIGRNPLVFEPETEMTPEFALKESLGEEPGQTGGGFAPRSEGSGSKHMGKQSSQMQHPTVPFFAPPLGAGKKQPEKEIHLDKDENGVIQSQDIRDHQYETMEEAIQAALWFGCDGFHTHKIKGKLIFMPCKME